VVAARTYASLGGFLHQIMSTRDCRCTPFYRRALEYDSKSEAALLGLATVFEKAGDPVAAVAFLRKLVDVHPRNREAALRLAINQLRSGFRRPAERGLEELTRVDGPEWVVAVAFQELARHHIDREDLQAALDVLQRGRERLPGNEPLALQYAYLLERDRQLNQAAEVLAAFRSEPPRQAAEARARYNHWPAATVDDVRRELWQGAESRLPMLAAALGRTDHGEEG
jgi:thioredoxin-like negative regulator of GroEL